MDIDFQSNGNVSGYKTEFLKKIFPNNDEDIVEVHNFINGNSFISVKDSSGHICDTCKLISHIFIEIPNQEDIFRICHQCIKKANYALEKIYSLPSA